MPPLRERRHDILELARHFIDRFAAEESKTVSELTAEAIALIESFDWPGNVRQLENTIFRAVVLCDGSMLDVCDFPQIAGALGIEPCERRPEVLHVAGHATLPARPISASPYAVSATNIEGHMRKLEELEAEIIRLAIGRYEGRMSEVARRLGIGRSTLYRKLKELGFEHDDETAEELKKAAG